MELHPAKYLKDKINHPVRHFKKDIHNVADFVVLVFGSDVSYYFLHLLVDAFKRRYAFSRTYNGCQSLLAVVGKLLFDNE